MLTYRDIFAPAPRRAPLLSDGACALIGVAFWIGWVAWFAYQTAAIYG